VDAECAQRAGLGARISGGWPLTVHPTDASVTLCRLAKNTDIAAGGAMLGFAVTLMLEVALG